ncbi:hypothetical protein [Rubrivirga sp.]|uniref:hypothetical protein n=1 Tax=Rubrivirga sp. TaxID=1885344 RepID=UPI003B52684A
MTVALAGRRIDAPDAAVARFPSEAVARVRAALRALFETRGTSALVCSGACGADLVALDVAGTLGLRRRLVLPTPPATFRASSVVDRPDSAHDWGALFDRVVGEVASRGDLVVLDAGAGHAGYVAATDAILDEAGRLSDGSPLAVVVWEGAARGPDDLTAAFAEAAGARGWPVIDVPTVPHDTG